MAEDIFHCGIYRHYKGPLYLVLGIARHSETQEEHAVYVPLYEHEGAAMAIRPLKMFRENVIYEGREQPRFAYVGQRLPCRDRET